MNKYTRLYVTILTNERGLSHLRLNRFSDAEAKHFEQARKARSAPDDTLEVFSLLVDSDPERLPDMRNLREYDVVGAKTNKILWTFALSAREADAFGELLESRFPNVIFKGTKSLEIEETAHDIAACEGVDR